MNGNYEASIINRAIVFCQTKIARPEISEAEKKAMSFYMEELQKISPCPDDQKFQKPYRRIGGHGDTEIIKPYVIRDRENNPVLRPDGKLRTIDCIFKDLATYIHYIQNGKHASFGIQNGIRPLNPYDILLAEHYSR